MRNNRISLRELENARVGYQAALNHVEFYGGKIWAIFNAMLVANSIVIAGIIVILNQPELNTLRIILPLIGLLLCASWFVMAKRSHSFSIYYMLSAREIEESYFSKRIMTFSRGGQFSDGKSVSIKIGGQYINYQMNIYSRFIKNELFSYLIIFTFVVLYSFLFFQNHHLEIS